MPNKQSSTTPAILFYVHDPMCSWCYAFAPVWQRIQMRLPDHIIVQYLLGGLAPDNEEDMPLSMQQHLQLTWEKIMDTVPGITFNFDFWQQNHPRRSTYPACRAVVAARTLSPEKETAMINAIQHAYYQQARNPSDLETLIALAEEIHLDKKQFAELMRAPNTQDILLQEIQQARAIKANSFPSLILRQDKEYHSLPFSYQDAEYVLNQF